MIFTNFVDAAVFMLVFFGPASIVGVAIYLILTSFKKEAARRQALMVYAGQQNYGFAAMPRLINNIGSFANGTYQNCMWGMLPKANVQFMTYEQIESRGSGKSKEIFMRTVANMLVPDTRTHLVINSQINHDARSGGSLARFKTAQKYEAEGNFAQFFDIYMPAGAEVEGLAILAPNTLQFILEHFADYDIEVIDNQAYFYIYRFIAPEEYDRLLTNLDQLLQLMRLSSDDATKSKLDAREVARVASDVMTPRRLAKSWRMFTGLGILGLVMFQFIPVPLRYATYHTVIYYILFCVVCFGATLLVFVQSSREIRLRKQYQRLKKQNRL